MTIEPHLLIAMSALKEVQAAMLEAIALLPEGIKQDRWILCSHNPLSWERLHFSYMSRADARDDITEVLADLSELAICREKLTGVVTRRRGHVEAPALPKVRRYQN